MHAFVNLNDMNKLILILHDKMMLKVITLLKHLISLLNYYDFILTLKKLMESSLLFFRLINKASNNWLDYNTYKQ